MCSTTYIWPLIHVGIICMYGPMSGGALLPPASTRAPVRPIQIYTHDGSGHLRAHLPAGQRHVRSQAWRDLLSRSDPALLPEPDWTGGCLGVGASFVDQPPPHQEHVEDVEYA